MRLAQNELRPSRGRRSVVSSEQPATVAAQSDALSERETASKTSSTFSSSDKLQMTEQTLIARNFEPPGAAHEGLPPQASASPRSLAVNGTTAAPMFRKHYNLIAPGAPQNAQAGASAA